MTSNLWGKPIWEFIHTFSFQIDEEYYTLNRDLICEILKVICTTLPCEFCNMHSKKYISNKLNGKELDTKDKLKAFFIEFHNSVNKRLHKPLFKEEQQNKYKTFNLNEKYKQFSRVYNGKMYNLKSFHFSKKRERTLYLIYKLINHCYKYVHQRNIKN